MDEILASIRRIIESGDERGPSLRPNARGVPSGGLRTAKDAAPAARPIPAIPVMPSFDLHYLPQAERAGAEARPSADDAAQAADAGAPGSEDGRSAAGQEVAFSGEDWNRLRPGSEDFGVSDLPVRYAEVEQRLEPALPDIGGAPPAENENAVSHRAAPPEFAFEFDDTAFEAALHGEAWDAKAPSPASSPQPEATEATAAEEQRPDLRPIPDSVLDGASALLSEQAGDQVAAAFDDLAHAIREGQMRSMEGMAREMLRPMLQEWLDDNLPRMVERLVREEIERIARGPRR